MKAIKITDREYGLKRLTRKVQRLQSRIKALEEKNLSLDGAEMLGRYKEARDIYEDMIDLWNSDNNTSSEVCTEEMSLDDLIDYMYSHMDDADIEDSPVIYAIIEALEEFQEAREKEKPIKIKVKRKAGYEDYAECVCGNRSLCRLDKFCSRCGKELEWVEDMEAVDETKPRENDVSNVRLHLDRLTQRISRMKNRAESLEATLRDFPLTVKHKVRGDFDTDYGVCPCCGAHMMNENGVGTKRCKDCGQMVAWE